jgi:hypothetical protein
MSSVSQILGSEFELLRAEAVAAYEASGQAASGNWGGNVKVELTETGASLTAPDYINGRKPGTPPPSEAIGQWLINKGIAARLEKDISVSSLAFLIARKIGREGWQPDKEDILASIVTPQRIQAILDKIGESQLEDFTTQVLNHLKTALT